MIHWKISTSSSSDLEIRGRLSAVQDRQFRAWALPAGISYEDMEEHWKSMKFSGESGQIGVDFKSSYVCDASHSVEILRELARAGRKDTEQLATLNAGKAPIVWGEPDLAIPLLDAMIPSDIVRDLDPSVVIDANADGPETEVEQQHINDVSATQPEEGDDNLSTILAEAEGVSGDGGASIESSEPEGPANVQEKGH